MASLEEGAFEAGMSLFAAMVAAEQRALERRERPARMLGAGTGREARIGGANTGFRRQGHADSYFAQPDA